MAVRITPYGGVGEIGGNTFVVEAGDTRVLLDMGMSFGAHGDFFAEFVQPRSRTVLLDLLRLGVLPAMDGIYREDLCRVPGIDDVPEAEEAPDLWEAPVISYQAYMERHGRPFVDAVCISHAHLDHVGHIPYIDHRVQLVGTPVTIEAMRAIERVSTNTVHNELTTVRPRGVAPTVKGIFAGQLRTKNKDPIPRAMRKATPNEPLRIGDIEATFIPVDHSIPGAAAILLRAEGKRILYSGDVRFHGLFQEDTKRLRDVTTGLRPDVFLCEGTRMGSDAPDDETQVERDLVERYKATTGLALVDFGWKDTTRFVTMQRVAEATGRTLVVPWKLAHMLHTLHGVDPTAFSPVEAYANVRVMYPRRGSMTYSDADQDKEPLQVGYSKALWKATDVDDPDTWAHRDRGARAPAIRQAPERYLVMVSQYEMQQLIDLAPPAGSAYVRAACEPFSDEMAIDLDRQANWLEHFGIPVVEDGGRRMPLTLHASGHACGPHIEQFVRDVDAHLVVPIHTEREDAFEDLGDIRVPAVGEPIVL